jgi:hypothetical protein
MTMPICLVLVMNEAASQFASPWPLFHLSAFVVKCHRTNTSLNAVIRSEPEASRTFLSVAVVRQAQYPFCVLP